VIFRLLGALLIAGLTYVLLPVYWRPPLAPATRLLAALGCGVFFFFLGDLLYRWSGKPHRWY